MLQFATHLKKFNVSACIPHRIIEPASRYEKVKLRRPVLEQALSFELVRYLKERRAFSVATPSASRRCAQQSSVCRAGPGLIRPLLNMIVYLDAANITLMFWR
jgi:hypothetical protein